MALLRHGTVKFNDKYIDSADDADGLMTLNHPAVHQNLPVYFCAMPFLLDIPTVREIIDNAATMRPQSVSVILDQQTHERHPDLMLSIQAYCIHNDDVINLESIEISPEITDAAESGITLVVGSDELLHESINNTKNEHALFIYFPMNIQDQLNLQSLLELDAAISVISVVSTGAQSFTRDQPKATAVVQVADLALAQDAQLFHWMEGNAAQLATQSTDTLSQLLVQYCNSEKNKSDALLASDDAALAKIGTWANHELNPDDVKAILMLIKVHISVLTDRLNDGTNARLWQLLSTLGHTLHFGSLAERAAKESAHLFGQSKTCLLEKIGELTPAEIVEPEHVEAAMLWLEEQHRLHIR